MDSSTIWFVLNISRNHNSFSFSPVSQQQPTAQFSIAQCPPTFARLSSPLSKDRGCYRRRTARSHARHQPPESGIFQPFRLDGAPATIRSTTRRCNISRTSPHNDLASALTDQVCAGKQFADRPVFIRAFGRRPQKFLNA